MTQTSSESTENSSLSSKSFSGIEDNSITFYTNQIVYYLDNVISKFNQGIDTSADCLKIEENCKLLIENFHKQVTKEQQSNYDAVINVVVGTKMILSEVFFGGLSKNPEKLNSKLLMMQNHSQKLKDLVGLFVV